LTALIPIDETKNSLIFVFDAALSENHHGEYEASEFALEATAVVSDHIIKKPRTWTLEGKCTATPLDAISYDAGRLVTLRSELEQLGDLLDLVSVVTDLDVFTASILNYDVNRALDDGNAFRVSVRLKEMFIATTATTTIPKAKLKAAARRKMGKGKKGGKTTGSTPKNGGTPKEKSWAKSWKDGVTGRK
jgi:hypothetical protein